MIFTEWDFKKLMAVRKATNQKMINRPIYAVHCYNDEDLWNTYFFANIDDAEKFCYNKKEFIIEDAVYFEKGPNPDIYCLKRKNYNQYYSENRQELENILKSKNEGWYIEKVVEK